MIARHLGILFIALLLASGCSSSDKDRREILNAMTTRTNAMNRRDISKYISVVSPRYNDKGKDFHLLKESLAKNFRDFEQISYEADKQTISIIGSSAESVSSYRMKVRVRGKEITLNGTEHLRLAKEPEGWKIIAGI